MGGSHQAAMNFWYELDNTYRYCQTELAQVMGEMFNGLGPNGELEAFFQWRNAMENGPYPDAYVEFMSRWQKNLSVIFDSQCHLLNKNLGCSPEAWQEAFELFGQGVMWDKRRNQEQANCPRGVPEVPGGYDYRCIHAMDATYSKCPGEQEGPPIGYYTWYAFLRAQVFLNGDASVDDHGRTSREKRCKCVWLQIARYIAMAAAIQNYMRPCHVMQAKKNPHNPSIDQGTLSNFRDKYLPMDFDELDQAFLEDPDLGPRP